ncbi:hypothetical protein D3Z09_18325 [Rahnella aquatilis]|nr:hypothetical protein D3Z09_18325 [Rahnella aquatilis]
MKNQMIKMSVIAALLSGISFTASAAPATTVALDLTATVVPTSCNVTLGTGQATQAWPGLIATDFSVTATPAQGSGDERILTLKVGGCSGAAVGTNGIQLTGVQGQTVGTSLLANDLWGDDDTTGIGFLISTSQDGTTWTALNPNDPKVKIAETTGTAAAAISGIDDVSVKMDVASYKASATIGAGDVHAVVTLAAVYL